MECNARNSDEAAYILMEDQRRNVTRGRLDGCLSVSQSASVTYRQIAGNDMWCMLWLQTRTAGSQHIYLPLMFYLLALCRAGCRLGHATPVEPLSAATERGVRCLDAARQRQPKPQMRMCVQWLHPFSLPHKIYKSSRHIKAVLGSRGWGTDGRGMKILGCCC